MIARIVHVFNTPLLQLTFLDYLVIIGVMIWPIWLLRLLADKLREP